MSLAIVFGIALLLVGAIVGAPRWRAWRRERWATTPFPPAWRAILRRRVPLYRRLPAELQRQLRRRIQVFVAEKPFLGCAGLVMTDEVRVTIAAQACLLGLNRDGPLFPGLRQVLVYPGAFAVHRVHADSAGVLREQRHALAGESWSQGQVVLSWQDTTVGAQVIDDGHNVVLHEFAHQLDQESGAANGAPRLRSRGAQARWAQVMNDEFQALQARLRARGFAGDRGHAGETSGGHAPTHDLIGDYGATNPAEFFAVVTEVFFERADALARRHSSLFAVLSDFYAVDPREWLAPTP